MSKRIKLKQAPKKPIRKLGITGNLNVEYEVEGFLDGLEKRVKDYIGGHCENVRDISLRVGSFCEDAYVEATFKYDEKVASFSERLARYEKQKKEYDRWYKQNKAQIEKELALRAEEKKDAALAKKNLEEAKLKAEIEKRKKRLSKLKGK